MTDFPSVMVNAHLHVQRQHPYPVPVGDPLHDDLARQKWLEEQHERDLETLDALDRDLEQGDVT